ncbi:glycosyltransferase family 8 protein [Limosilactobacillus ingluviei]|uniref:glycosyltransferase family 8 protein n=2 Tax=Limosilactobacillus ingluviei TaxID=148604 RepID=UPI0023F454F0|nr:glycosyltransferase family 8 protein [Limosilactobacillus ingluviei]
MPASLTAIVIAPMYQQLNLTRCLTSLAQQSLAGLQTLIITDQPQPDATAPVVLTTDFSWPHLLELAHAHAQTTWLTFINANDLLMEADRLEQLWDEVQEKRADVGRGVPLTLADGKFNYRFPSGGTFHLLTPNNILPFMRLEPALRQPWGVLFKRTLIPPLQARGLADSAQALVYALIQVAEKAILSQIAYYCLAIDDGQSLPAFQWRPEYEYSPLRRLVATWAQTPQPPVADRIQVVSCIDDNLIDHLPTLLYSIDQTTDHPVDFHLVYYRLSQAHQARLAQCQTVLTHTTLVMHQLPKVWLQLIESLNLKDSRLPIGTYFRFLLPLVLNDLPRVLYLDTDLIVNRSLWSLWQTELNGYPIAASEDSSVTVFRQYGWNHGIFGPQGDHYFNAGVVLMDLTRLRQINAPFACAQLAQDTADLLVHADQDVQNLYFYRACRLWDHTANYGLEYFDRAPLPLDEITIIHYYGPKKPWHNLVTEAPMSAARKPAIHRYRQLRNQMQARLGDWPLAVTVIVDARDLDPTQFEACLESLWIQTYTNLSVVILTERPLPADLAAYLQQVQGFYPHTQVVTGDWATAANATTDPLLFTFQLDQVLATPHIISQLVAALETAAAVQAHQSAQAPLRPLSGWLLRRAALPAQASEVTTTKINQELNPKLHEFTSWTTTVPEQSEE